MSESNQVTPDKAAAHELLSELRTRITTQKLPYQFGVEASTLESLWQVFSHARDAMKKNPGCEKFASLVSRCLNEQIRPITSKWHRANEEGRLKSLDGAHEFRRDLADLQDELCVFADDLHQLAYDSKRPSETSKPAIDPKVLDEYFEPLEFGIPLGVRIDDDRDAINLAEREAVLKRRARYELGGSTEMDAFRKSEGKSASPVDAAGGAANARPTNTERETDAIGLALSGGGIRSATFCLGVVQVLAEHQLLKELDYLSTVSGGGYTGSFLTRRLGEKIAQPTTPPSQRPPSETEVATPHGPDTEPVRYVRQNAKFLAARNLKQGWGMVTATLAGMVLNWMVPLLIIILLAMLAAGTAYWAELNWKWSSQRAWPVIWKAALAGFGILSALALFIYGWTMRNGRGATYKAGVFLGWTLALTVAVAAAWAISRGYPGVPNTIVHWGGAPKTRGLSVIFAALVAVAPVIIRFLPVLKNPVVRRVVLRVLLFLAGLIVPLAGLIVFYLCWHFSDHNPNGFLILAIAAGVLAILDLFLLNVNLTAPHRLYRDSLARTFIQKSDEDSTPVPMTGINPESSAPYHLINAALNLPSTEHPAVRDRHCDFFLFSKAYCGSPAIRYFPTSHWKANGDPVDLATAMAVSGAAFSSYMGLGSLPTLTALLTFLNVRLGFWIKKPKPATGQAPKPSFEHPGFICLLREMFGYRMSEKQRWLNLSDGGHIENLGVYELLRRRCKFIICVDGEADPTFTFQGFMTLVRHARIDLGVTIEPKLDSLRPDATSGVSQGHSHFCRIQYPAMGDMAAGTGFLLYIKLSVTGNETEVIKRYRINHADFPHQTTLDQFFDQEQFEAYRQLGVHCAEGLFHPPFWFNGKTPATGRLPAWFRNLAENLLQPEAVRR